MIDSKQLEPVLEEIIQRWEIPGLAVGIVEGKEIVTTHGFGVQSLETGTAVTPETVFCMASIAKCFVASAILQLEEQGTIELDAPVVQYLPYFRLADERYRKITIRQVLSHTSGMPDMDEVEYDELVAHPETEEGAAERYVRSLSERKMIAEPGARFYYSNIAYNVLGDLIAKACGNSFEASMKENILRPAGMMDSTFLPAEVDRQRLARPHLRTPEMTANPIQPYHRGDAPASFLYATAIDMCHWAITSLNQGEYQGRRILKSSSYDLMWKPVVKRGFPPFREEMGLGWSLGHFAGFRTVGHGGGGWGWTCFLALLPERDLATIILCNEESPAHERVLEAVLEAMLGQAPQAGSVSWMIPISQALGRGGIGDAYARYEEIKTDPAFYLDPDDLVTLAYQLIAVKKLDLAIEVLEFNLHAFPKHLGTTILLGRLLKEKADYLRGEALVEKALAIFPGNPSLTSLLADIQTESKAPGGAA